MTTVLELIRESYKIIGVYSEERPLEGFRSQEGLHTLNKLVDGLAAKTEYVAFNDKLEFNLTVGQQSYELSNQVTADVTSNRLISIKSCSLSFGNNLYSLRVLSDSDYYKTDRVLGSNSRPRYLFLQNNVGKSEITFFNPPVEAYSCIIIGRFILNNYSHVTDDIDNVPLYFIQFLESALARRLHEKYPGSLWNEIREKRYLELLRDVTQASDKPDMTLRNYENGSLYLGDIRGLYS